MLSGGFMDVMKAGSTDEFRAQVVRFTKGLGFETVTAMTVIDHGLNNSEFFAVKDTRAYEFFKTVMVSRRRGGERGL